MAYWVQLRQFQALDLKVLYRNLAYEGDWGLGIWVGRSKICRCGVKGPVAGVFLQKFMENKP